MLSSKEKKKVIAVVQRSDTDTGSTEVQLAILSAEIKRLAAHLKKNPKDNHSRRGLLGMVARRKKLADYLRTANAKRYANVARKLDLKR